MSNIDFQNGFICGMATKGLTKLNVDAAFTGDHLYFFANDNFYVSQSVINSYRGFSDSVQALNNVTPVVANNGVNDTFTVSSFTSGILFSDSSSTELE